LNTAPSCWQATAALLTLSLGAQAQTAAPAPDLDSGSLAPVVIIGNGSAEQRWRSSATADVVYGGELREGQLQINLSEGLGRVPGLVIRNRQNYAQDLQVSIRGHGARSTFGVRGVRLFVDGIPASAPDGSGQAANFPLGSAERIEVVRGPFASLYGSSSGGAILLYTEDGGQPGEIRTGAALSANGLWRFSTQIKGQTGTLEVPGWSYTLDVGKFATDGARPQSAADRSTVNLKLSRAHGGGRTVVLLNQQRGFALDPLGQSRAEFETDDEQTTLAAMQFNTRKSVSQSQLGLAWDQALGGGHKIELMGYVGSRQVVQYQSIPTGAQGLTSSGGLIDLDRTYWGWNGRWRWSGEAANGRVNLSAGLASDRQTDERKGYQNFIGPTLGVRGALRRDETNRATTLDPYIQGEWATEQLTLSAGLRRVRTDYTSNDRFVVGANGNDSGEKRFRGNLPVVGARWQLTPALQVFANIGKGLEIPTLNEVAYQSSGAAGFNTALNAARSTGAEAGLRGRNGAGLWNATVFDIRTDDEIVVQNNTGGRSTFQNAGRTKRQGLELSAEYGLGQVTLTGAYTHIRASYQDSFLTCAQTQCPGVNPQVLVLAGNQMPGIPNQQLFAQVAWAPNLSGSWAAGSVFTLEARHAGRVFVNDLNSDAAAGHTLFGLGARFEQTTGAWTWREFIRIDNLADKKHAGSVIVNDGNRRFFEPGLGRSLSAGIELTRRF
jgi:iron complex outermembrane receptor protein